MNEQDITICTAAINHIQESRIYYYQGNVFQPTGYKNRKVQDQTESKIRAWLRSNKEMVLKDRSDPNYKTLSHLVELHFKSVDNG